MTIRGFSSPSRRAAFRDISSRSLSRADRCFRSSACWRPRCRAASSPGIRRRATPSISMASFCRAYMPSGRARRTLADAAPPVIVIAPQNESSGPGKTPTLADVLHGLVQAHGPGEIPGQKHHVFLASRWLSHDIANAFKMVFPMRRRRCPWACVGRADAGRIWQISLTAYSSSVFVLVVLVFLVVVAEALARVVEGHVVHVAAQVDFVHVGHGIDADVGVVVNDGFVGGLRGGAALRIPSGSRRTVRIRAPRGSRRIRCTVRSCRTVRLSPRTSLRQTEHIFIACRSCS